MQGFSEDKKVKETIFRIKNTNHDYHLLFSQIGESLGYVNEETIRDAFLTTWCEKYPEEVESLVNLFKDGLPRDSTIV